MARYPSCENRLFIKRSVTETTSASLFSAAASTCAVGGGILGHAQCLVTGFKHAGQKAVCFHALNLRSAMKELPWRMGGIFCSCRRGDRYSLVRGKFRNKPVSPEGVAQAVT